MSRTNTDTPDGETREIREIRQRVRMGEYVAAAVEQRGVAGAEAEYNAARQLTTGLGRFPLDLLAPREVRTASTTDADGQVTQSNWLDRLFSETSAMRLGISFESVSPGASHYPGGHRRRIGGAARAQRGCAANAAWTVGGVNLEPSRNSASVCRVQRR